MAVPALPGAREAAELGVAGIGRADRKPRPGMVGGSQAVSQDIIRHPLHLVEGRPVARILVVEAGAFHPVGEFFADVVFPALGRRRRLARIPGAIEERDGKPVRIGRRGKGPGPAAVQVAVEGTGRGGRPGHQPAFPVQPHRVLAKPLRGDGGNRAAEREDTVGGDPDGKGAARHDRPLPRGLVQRGGGVGQGQVGQLRQMEEAAFEQGRTVRALDAREHDLAMAGVIKGQEGREGGVVPFDPEAPGAGLDEAADLGDGVEVLPGGVSLCRRPFIVHAEEAPETPGGRRVAIQAVVPLPDNGRRGAVGEMGQQVRRRAPAILPVVGPAGPAVAAVAPDVVFGDPEGAVGIGGLADEVGHPARAAARGITVDAEVGQPGHDDGIRGQRFQVVRPGAGQIGADEPDVHQAGGVQLAGQLAQAAGVDGGGHVDPLVHDVGLVVGGDEAELKAARAAGVDQQGGDHFGPLLLPARAQGVAPHPRGTGAHEAEHDAVADALLVEIAEHLPEPEEGACFIEGIVGVRVHHRRVGVVIGPLPVGVVKHHAEETHAGVDAGVEDRLEFVALPAPVVGVDAETLDFLEDGVAVDGDGSPRRDQQQQEDGEGRWNPTSGPTDHEGYGAHGRTLSSPSGKIKRLLSPFRTAPPDLP